MSVLVSGQNKKHKIAYVIVSVDFSFLMLKSVKKLRLGVSFNFGFFVLKLLAKLRLGVDGSGDLSVWIDFIV